MAQHPRFKPAQDRCLPAALGVVPGTGDEETAGTLPEGLAVTDQDRKGARRLAVIGLGINMAAYKPAPFWPVG